MPLADFDKKEINQALQAIQKQFDDLETLLSRHSLRLLERDDEDDDLETLRGCVEEALAAFESCEPLV